MTEGGQDTERAVNERLVKDDASVAINNFSAGRGESDISDIIKAVGAHPHSLRCEP